MSRCGCDVFWNIKTHHYIIYALSYHYILSREWRVIIHQVQTNMMVGIWCYNQSGVTEMLIMRDPYYDRMCFKSVKTLGALHSQLWKRPRPSATAFSTAKNVELRGLYPIRNTRMAITLLSLSSSVHRFSLWKVVTRLSGDT